jgi:hypothetical protein
MRMRKGGWVRAVGAILVAVWSAALPFAESARADVPWPTCTAAGCSDPDDFASYLFVAPGTLPNDYSPTSGEAWKYVPDSGMDIIGVWETTTGRPDVVIAVLDSGIRWDERDLANKVALHAGELEPASGCAALDCNGDGFVSVADFASVCGPALNDSNGNGFCDGQDLIRLYSDGVDDDGNGYVDDIAGWDFADRDNDPDDIVRYGHGTGEASDEVAEANNGSGFPGFAPSVLFLPLKVADSFVGIDQDFSQAVVYAVDREVSVISEALGTVNASAAGQDAVDYAYRRGIPLIASAADEESRHHNYPANYDHGIWVNSVRNGDGTLLEGGDVNGYELLNGCTNYGGHAWVAIPSASCSSEATSRAGGLVALLVSHGKNLIDLGDLEPYPGLDTPFSAEEVRQLLRLSARDVDQSASPGVANTGIANILGFLISAPALGLNFGTSHFPTQPEWDQFTGYGRPDGRALLARVSATTLPPEADLSGGLAWFSVVDPARTPSVPVAGSARAARRGNQFSWTLEAGCGVQPLDDWHEIGSGVGGGAALEQAVLANWSPAATAAACGFDPAAPIEDPDAHTVTLRLRVTDTLDNVGEDRRTVAIHADPTLRFAPRALGGSGESSPALADVNRDGVLDVVHGGGSGEVRAIDGTNGADLPGFPVGTAAIPVHPSPGYTSGEVAVPREAVIASIAADDLDGDGRVEIVAASVEGRLYVFDDHGAPRPGFPVSTDPALSDPANRNPLNDTDPGVAGAPVLVDLDAPGTHPALEIVFSALDGHLYAFRADGSSVSGFPVRLADRSKVSIDPATGEATPLPGVSGVRSRAAKSLSSPAVGDLDGDGRPELVVATNEEYEESGNSFAIESPLFAQLALLLAQADLDDLSLDTQGRVYAVHPDGNDAPGGPFLAGWPAAVPLLTPGVLPTVGTGTPGSPAIGDATGEGDLRVAVFGAIGPVVLLEPDGSPALGEIGGLPRVLGIDFPAGFPNVPATAGSPDAPFFGALGSGAFGDLTGDGLPEYVAATGGLRKLLDIVAPAQQGLLPAPGEFVVPGFADHQLSAWDPTTGAVLPAFPRLMDDMQFIGSPSLADVSGDGLADVVNGSGAYLVRAYTAAGQTPAGWPKFTHGWHIGSPTAGDVDGDGLVEVVAITREGTLFAWDTPGVASEAAVAWSGFGRDRRNTKNEASGVPTGATAVDPLAGLGWVLESVHADLAMLIGTLPAADARALRRSAAPFLIPIALDHVQDDAELRLAAVLPGIEYGLLLPTRPIAGLAPLEARFRAGVRAALARLVESTDCAPADPACQFALQYGPGFLNFGDYWDRYGFPQEAVFFWAQGIAIFDRL